MRKTNHRIIIWVLCSIFVSCSGRETIKEDPFLQKWRLAAETSRGHSPTMVTKTVDIPEAVKRKAVAEEDREKVEPIREENPLPTKNISIKLNNVEISTAIRAIARAANQNILINDIEGRMSIHILDTPWDQAFTSILNAKSLTYVVEGKILRVLTLKEREFLLNKEAELMARKKKVKQLEPLLPPKIIPINYADAAKIQENLIKLLSKGVDGKESYGAIAVDEHTNSLIIRATREDLTKLVELINQLDKPTAQILIEAHIIETTRDTARELGIQWGGNIQATNKIFPNTIQLKGGRPSNFIVDFPAALGSGGGAALGLTLGSLTGSVLLDAQLSALEKEGKLTILSRPSITTLDNQTAYTENGTKIPFVTTATTTGSANIQTVEFVDVVLRLEITPHVIDGKNLKLKIAIKKDEIDETRNVLGNPFIIKKQTETTLIVQDGHTIVIAGLTKEVKSGSVVGVPWFKDIPVLGWLFKRDNKIVQMEEVLIFITPHILKEEGMVTTQ